MKLSDILRSISESAYYADWMRDTEFEVWRLASEGGTWGRLDASDSRVADSFAMAIRAGAWVMWNDAASFGEEVSAIPIDDWRRRYASWRRTHPGRDR